MTSISLIQDKKKIGSATWPVTCSVLVTLFLFWLDEGAYNFEWMKRGGNWIAFAIYLGGFLIGQIIVHELILIKYKGKDKMVITCIIGIPLGFAILMCFFFGLK